MTVSYDNANKYFQYHKLKDVWSNAYDAIELLVQAENMLVNTFTLREGYKDSLSYEHAVYEQAIHMLSFDKERYILQTEGVKLYSYDGIQVQMEQSLISPIAFKFLRKHICRKVGDIR